MKTTNANLALILTALCLCCVPSLCLYGNSIELTSAVAALALCGLTTLAFCPTAGPVAQPQGNDIPETADLLAAMPEAVDLTQPRGGVLSTLRYGWLMAQVVAWTVAFNALCLVSRTCREIKAECQRDGTCIDPLAPLLAEIRRDQASR